MPVFKKNIPLRVISITSFLISSLATALIVGAIRQNKAPFELMWSIPVAVGMLQIFHTMMIVDGHYNSPVWLLVLMFYAASGAWMAFALDSVFILSEWHAQPDRSGFEPLFTSTGLCAGVCAWLQGSYRNSLKKVKMHAELWHE